MHDIYYMASYFIFASALKICTIVGYILHIGNYKVTKKLLGKLEDTIFLCHGN